MNRDEILDTAKQIVCSDREKQYGEAKTNFALIGLYWKLLTGQEYPPERVALMLALMKVGRITTGQSKMDNYIDAIGYLALAGELESGGNIPPDHELSNAIQMEKWRKIS